MWTDVFGKGSQIPIKGGARTEERGMQFEQVSTRSLWNQCREAASFTAGQPSFFPRKLTGSASRSGTSSGKTGVDASGPIPAPGIYTNYDLTASSDEVNETCTRRNTASA